MDKELEWWQKIKKELRILNSLESTQGEITMLQFVFLHFIFEGNKKKRVSDIAILTDSSKSMASAQITRLIKKGLVEIDYSVEDRRKHYLSLTPLGTSIYSQLTEQFTDLIKEAHERLRNMNNEDGVL